MKVTHSSLIQKARTWLLQKHSVVVTEIATGYETPDAIGFGCNGSTLIEVKVSRSDFLRDKYKGFRRKQDMGMGNFRYYLAPPDMLKPEDIPENWGLLTLSGRGIKIVQKAKFISLGIGANAERSLLISAIRRIGRKCPEGVYCKAYYSDSIYQGEASVSVNSEID